MLLYKLATRPIVRTVFSVGLGAMFAIFAIFGPPLLFLTQRLNQNVNKKLQRLLILYRILQEDQSSLNCARFMEIRLVIYESLKVIFKVFSPSMTS